MSDIETVTATLVMRLDAQCPYCHNTIDLFKEDSNDEGQLYDDAISDAAWEKPQEERVECDVECENCDTEFKVKGLFW